MAADPVTLSEISMLNFEHIKYGERCPLNDHVITRMMRDFRFQVEQKDLSLLLAQYLDDCHGTEQMVDNRRKVTAASDYIHNANNNLLKWLTGGSVGDGFRMRTSDSDAMHVMMSVVVVDPDQTHFIPEEDIRKTILHVKGADCRPGYVALEIVRIAEGSGTTTVFNDAIVPFGDSMYLSSDIYRQGKADALARAIGVGCVSNGPCSSVYSKHYKNSIDVSDAFPCISWPNAAHEWIYRPRLYGWPAQTMIDRIVQGGCHVVPVGDKCSTDTLLQWRISFACAEQLLVHSLTHPQFRVYGLLKYFLFQIKDLLDHIIGDRDVICSYFLKTLIFYAVENSPHLLWSEQNTFICFRFCLSILTAWVKSGYCPNYFIQSNNMFLRKIRGDTRQNLLHLLKDMYNLKWMCLCIESGRCPYIGQMLQQHKGATSRQLAEYIRDLDLFRECLFSLHQQTHGNRQLYWSMQCLHISQTDADDFIAYFALVTTLTSRASELFNENTTGSNKRIYIAMKKCKHFLTPKAVMCTSPGLMILATFHYLTADYSKTLQMCIYMRSTGRLYIGKSIPATDISRASHPNPSKNVFSKYLRYCEQGYTLYHRFREMFYSCLVFTKYNSAFCLPQLHLEITRHPLGVYIPPLPYAAFLSFLCYHELGDLRGRDTELINLRAANYEPHQGGQNYWIVHTLLGICYQTVGDNCRAIRSFTDSLRVMPDFNPAVERIGALLSK